MLACAHIRLKNGQSFTAGMKMRSFWGQQDFSAPLTLLYGRSGVGKSSLLRVRVIPDLRKPDVAAALVVYLFDCWSDRDVESAIKVLIKTAVSEQIGSGDAGVPKPVTCSSIGRATSTRRSRNLSF